METLIQVLTPVLTAIGGWLAGRRKQNNDFLGELQASINLLSQENRKLMEEVVGLRRENIRLQANQEILIEQNQGFREELEELKRILKERNIPLPLHRKRKYEDKQSTN